MEVNHIKLNHCWICGDTASLHDHHIIPRAYGGTDGPQVTLCASCHNGVHHVADGRGQMRPDYWDSRERIDKSNMLINTIIKARNVSSGSANKTVIVILNLTAEEASTLDAVKNLLGLRGRVATLKTLINNTYQRMTKS